MLTVLLASCSHTPPDSTLLKCETGVAALTGVYDAAADVCQLDPSVEVGCALLWSWWSEPGCPPFETYVRRARPEPDGSTNLYGTPWDAPTAVSYSVKRCTGLDEVPFYDVVLTRDGRAGDAVHESEVAFDTSGNLLRIRLTDYYNQYPRAYCCLPAEEMTNTTTWGTAHFDCTYAIVYTPADFPDSADTGTPHRRHGRRRGQRRYGGHRSDLSVTARLGRGRRRGRGSFLWAMSKRFTGLAGLRRRRTPSS